MSHRLLLFPFGAATISRSTENHPPIVLIKKKITLVISEAKMQNSSKFSYERTETCEVQHHFYFIDFW